MASPIISAMLLRIQGAIYFRTTREDFGLTVECRSCGARLALTRCPRALMVHLDGCELLALMRDLERLPKPFNCRVHETGTALYHEAITRLA